jgi:signal transduction histidine kinase
MVGRDVSATREVERIRAYYINMTSHELASSLLTISGNIGLVILENEQRMPAGELTRLRTALATTLALDNLAADLEVLSRRDANQWTITPEATNLAAEAYGAADEVRVIADNKGVILEAQRLAQPLPLAWVDPRRARQVARNLITNAIKYTPAGGRIAVAVSADEQWVWLQVQDTGVGIPKALQERIWDRYFRAPAPDGEEQAPGQGLGLAIVRIITEAHGGKRAIVSDVDKGTLISIGFPRADRALAC